MKKILAIALIIGCIFAFASCSGIVPDIGGNNNSNNNVDNEGNTQSVEAIQQAIDESAPKSSGIDVKYTTEIGTLEGSYDVTYNSDGSATVNYTYELFNKFDPSNPTQGNKTVYTDTVTVKANGELDKVINGVAAVEAVSFDIELDEDLLDSCIISASVLKATVKADNTLDVLGVEIGCDVNITISTGNGRVTSVVMDYTTDDDAHVEIVAVYNY